MNPQVQKTIDTILDTVKEPETLRSVAELGLVKKVTVSDSAREILVTMDIAEPRLSCFVCSVVNEKIRGTIQERLKAEFEKEFPGYRCGFC